MTNRFQVLSDQSMWDDSLHVTNDIVDTEIDKDNILQKKPQSSIKALKNYKSQNYGASHSKNVIETPFSTVDSNISPQMSVATALNIHDQLSDTIQSQDTNQKCSDSIPLYILQQKN